LTYNFESLIFRFVFSWLKITREGDGGFFQISAASPMTNRDIMAIQVKIPGIIYSFWLKLGNIGEKSAVFTTVAPTPITSKPKT